MKLIFAIAMCPVGCNMEGRKHQFSTEGGSFGRAADNDWVLPDPSRYVSSRHGRINFENNQFVLTDESTNGIYVNDALQPLGAHDRPALKNGDQLAFGDYKIKVCIEAEVPTDQSSQQTRPAAMGAVSVPSEKPVFVDDLDKWLEPAAPTSEPVSVSQPAINNSSSPSVTPIENIDLGLKAEEKDPLALLGLGQQNEIPSIPAAQSGSLTDLLGETPPLDQQMMKVPNVIPDDWDDLLGGSSPDKAISNQAALNNPFQEQETNIRSKPADPDATCLDSVEEQSSSADVSSPVEIQSTASLSESVPIALEDQDLSELLAIPTPSSQSNDRLGVAAELSQVSGINPVEKQQITSTTTGDELAQALGLAQLSVEQKNILNDAVANTVKETVSGMMRTLRARSEIKSEFRMNMTTIQSAENNPLKFSVTPEDAIENMFAKQGKAYLSPIDAINDGFADISDHQIALFDAMKAAYEHILGQFDPDLLARKFDKSSSKRFLGGSKGKNWDAYQSLYDEYKEDNEVTFKRLFGEVFADAYERRMHSLKMSRTSLSTHSSDKSPGNKTSK